MTNISMPGDMATWLYATGFLIKGYGFGLFLWWWDKARRNDSHISTVFVYIMLILLGSCIRDGVEMYGGFCRSTLELSQEHMEVWVYDTWFWPARMLITNLAFTALIAHMSIRAFWQRGK